jgi:hypothetical protein
VIVEVDCGVLQAEIPDRTSGITAVKVLARNQIARSESSGRQRRVREPTQSGRSSALDYLAELERVVLKGDKHIYVQMV